MPRRYEGAHEARKRRPYREAWMRTLVRICQASSPPCCTLCPRVADPMTGLMTKDGDYYPLCDGHAPTKGNERAVADTCRASGKAPRNDIRVVFGFNEDDDVSARP